MAVSSEQIVYPSMVYDDPWVWEQGTEPVSFDASLMGKWMMFFYKGELLDSKWEKAVQAFRAKKLFGIKGMKCSTNYDNHRATNNKTGVIIYYCGPYTDEQLMKDYGRNLLQHIPYWASFMYYKTDAQTYEGTRATGQLRNHLYKLSVKST
jgi:hypothetical protein